MRNLSAIILSLAFAATTPFAQNDDFDNGQEIEQYAAESTEAEASAPETAEAPADQAPVQASTAANSQPTAQEEPQTLAGNAKEPAPDYGQDSGYGQEESYASNNKKSSRFGFGVKGAFEYGTIYGFEDDSEIDGNATGTGYSAGLMIRIQLVDGFAFAPEINFSTIETKHEHEYFNATRTYSRKDLELPLLLRGSIQDRFYICFGPQLNFNMGDDAEIESNGNSGIEEKISQSSLDFGMAIGAGISIVQGLVVDVRFYMGLSELFPDVTYAFGDDVDKFDNKSNQSALNMAGAKMMKIKVGIGYWFL